MRILIYILTLFPLSAIAQDDLLNEIDTDSTWTNYADATFKGLKIVNFESTKLVAKNQLTFIVAHRFGSIENGIDNFFGLDDAVTRLSFIYGISDRFNVGISRSSFNKTYQASIKYRLLRQIENGFPFTIVGHNEVFINTGLEKDNLPLLKFKHRLSYTSQLLISRKINTNLSVELAPTYLHENLTSSIYNSNDIKIGEQDNSQFALGLGGRYKISKRWSINADYGWHMNRDKNSPFKNPLSIGFDLETGGHVFQMHFT
ncbi:MAG TPA: DUF5777 family beta-barrel protein, partial [Mariniflexile sp.]